MDEMTKIKLSLVFFDAKCRRRDALTCRERQAIDEEIDVIKAAQQGKIDLLLEQTKVGDPKHPAVCRVRELLREIEKGRDTKQLPS